MLNTEMVNFFESILDARSDEFRVTDQDLVSEQAFEKKQAKIRAKVVELLRLREVGERFGMKRLDKDCHVLPLPAPSVEVTERVACDGYTREHWIMETLPGIHMPLFVLIPDGYDKTVKHPCILAAHGHGPGKDSVVGTSKVPEMLARLKNAKCYGDIMAKAGYMVFAPDMWGFGERRTKDDAVYGDRDCAVLSDAAEACGLTLLGLFVWDHMRIVDYMLAQEYCSEAAMMGFSGGGEQTIYTTALDERIVWGYAGGYLHKFKGGMLYNHMCACNFVPDLFKTMELSDVAGLIVPRPMLYENGTEDGLNGHGGIVNVEEAAGLLRKMYAVYGKEDNLETNFWPGGHQYNGAKTMDFAKKHF